MDLREFLELYSFNRSIGCGQFSRVYSATAKTGRQVVVKLLLKNPGSSGYPYDYTPDQPTIERDIVLSERMNSTYLVKVLDVYEDPNVTLLVSESVQGRDLFQWILKKGYISEAATAALATHVLLGLKVLHDNAIVHLDLKPENILIVESPGPSYTAKLTDYCLAGTIDADDELRGTWRTEVCTAPEIRGSDRYDGTADIWSLGVILFIILSGQPPFMESTSRIEAEKAGLTKAMEKREWSLVSEEGKDFIQQCMAWDPAQRMTVEDALAHPWLTTEMEEVALPEVLRKFQITAMGRRVVRAIGAWKKSRVFKQFTRLAQDQD
jgi:serine/threonine protein kinase